MSERPHINGDGRGEMSEDEIAARVEETVATPPQPGAGTGATKEDQLDRFEFGLEDYGAMTNVVGGRQRKLLATDEQGITAQLTKAKGLIETANERMEAAREAAKAHLKRAAEATTKVTQSSERRDEWIEVLESLPWIARIGSHTAMLVALALALFLLDVGVIATAFPLIPGDLVWKIVLALGVALASVAISIGTGLWCSASESPIREGRAAAAATVAIAAFVMLALGLVNLLRAEAGGEDAIGVAGFLFLSFFQAALMLVEALVYLVLFEGRRAARPRREIADAEREITEETERERAEKAAADSEHARVIEIGREAAEARELIAREPQLREHAAAARRGEATYLIGMGQARHIEYAERQKLLEAERQREVERADQVQPRRWSVGRIALGALAAGAVGAVLGASGVLG